MRTDDQSFYHTSFAGCNFTNTPAFDRVAAEGIELMKLKYSKADKAIISSENLVAIDFLKQNGFSNPSQENKRMILGNDLNWSQENYYSRIGENLGK